MIKGPSQQLFDELFKLSKKLGYDTYDSLPNEGVSYPFVEVGEISIIPIPTKSYALGKASATIHVWGSIESRQVVSSIMDKLLNGCLAIVDVPNGHQWRLQLGESSSRLLQDNSSHSPLWHGILQVTFKFI